MSKEKELLGTSVSFNKQYITNEEWDTVSVAIHRLLKDLYNMDVLSLVPANVDIEITNEGEDEYFELHLDFEKTENYELRELKDGCSVGESND